ncbi:M13 family metallopeptidase [Streptococcus sciuri]|uniref:Endopeptidase n=1 Tax=Streptococcus sciuri TaxID=2973939 RepID=A0ABT2F7S1_9STRE|nr:M13-type metalloendopeptidase [Streptococcus sciuri]MCS4487905.1 endopeptidase [Streptococcus sciuri]
MVNLKDNFYEAVNSSWLQQVTLKETQTHVDNFTVTTDLIESILHQKIREWMEGEKLPEGSYLDDFLKFYSQAVDFKERERIGITPILSAIDEYREIKSFKDYTSKISSMELEGKPNFLPFNVAPDLFNTQLNVLWADAPNLILHDISYYDDNEEGNFLLQEWKKCQKELLMELGFSVAESEDVLDKVIELDKLISKHLLSNEERLDVKNTYISYDFHSFSKLVPELPLISFFEDILGEVPSKIIVSEQRFWEDFAKELYSEKYWEYLKARLIYIISTTCISCLTENIRCLSESFNRFLMGTEEVDPPEVGAFNLAQFAFSNELGYWYSQNYLSFEDIQYIREMVDGIISMYCCQIRNTKQLEEHSRKKSLEKLKNMVIQIGGPTELMTTTLVSQDRNLYENARNILKQSIINNWKKWNQKVERTDWEVPAFSVDPLYYSQLNKIILPAGLLQKPFYSREYSRTKNLSRIGFLIAHEISHAFDIEGALFDEVGNFGNWWSEKDSVVFQEMTMKIIDHYNQREMLDLKVDGYLTASENIADIAGFSCILEIVKQESSTALQELFINYAKLWRCLSRKEYLEFSIMSDNHSPNKLRANLVLSNTKEFLETFDIAEEDGMWQDLNKCITIW